MSPPLRLVSFRADITPPLGSPLCAGLIRNAERIENPLLALGVVLLSEEAPIVLCAVDWCEICNEDYVLWREALAAAAETSPSRVTVHCVHQHDAPITSLAALALQQTQGIDPPLMDKGAFHQSIRNTCDAIRAALPLAEPVTEIRTGSARVEQVASNRRVKGLDGRIRIRWSRCPDVALRAAPEGEIDPELTTVSFWNGPKKLVALHYYAVHPMSTYGQGGISWDFAGMARERRTMEEGVPHLYFTGCAGEITTGKYNDGAPENRQALAERLHAGMVASEETPVRFPATMPKWRSVPVVLPRRTDRQEAELLQTLADRSATRLDRTLAALWLAFVRNPVPIPVTALHFGDKLSLLHLPGEALIGYQLYAKSLLIDRTVAVACYTDTGMGYIPLAEHFSEEGGYEETWAFAAPESEQVLKKATRQVLLETTTSG